MSDRPTSRVFQVIIETGLSEPFSFWSLLLIQLYHMFRSRTLLRTLVHPHRQQLCRLEPVLPLPRPGTSHYDVLYSLTLND